MKMFVTGVVENDNNIWTAKICKVVENTHLRWGGKYYNSFVANFLLILIVKEFW